VTCRLGRAGWREAGDESFEAAIPAQIDRRRSVASGRLDLGAGPDDPLVAHQILDIPVTQAGAVFEVEIPERFPEGGPLAEDGRPAEAGLEGFQGEAFEHRLLAGHRNSPFLVVIVPHHLAAIGPAAADPAVIFEFTHRLHLAS